MTATVTISWSEGRPMPQGRASFAGGLLGGKLVVAGGTYWHDGVKLWSDAVDLYDPAADTWRPGPALPHPLAYAASACSEAGGLEVFGGHDGTGVALETWVLPDLAGAWRRSGLLPSSRLHGRAATLGARTYLLGGARSVADFRAAHGDVLARSGGSAEWTTEAEHRYDPASKRWTRLADLPQGARGLTATVVGDRWIYLFGGNTASTEEENRRPPDHGYLRRVLVYDVETGGYTEATPLARPAMLLDFVLRQGVLYGAGGETMTDTVSFGRSHRLYVGRLQ
jgi:N-acetylneuraminic acid mutarotase